VRTNIVSHFVIIIITMSQVSEKEEFTTSKWKVFSGFHCEYDYREWEDELLARLRIKRVDYLVDESYLNINPPTNAEARADAATSASR